MQLAADRAAREGGRVVVDVFQLAVDPLGKANIVYTAGQEGPPDPTTGFTTSDTHLFFVKEQ